MRTLSARKKGLIVPARHAYTLGRGMSKVIRVKYENGVLKPLEPLDLRRARSC
jgi:hypothetical protein